MSIIYYYNATLYNKLCVYLSYGFGAERIDVFIF